MVEIVVKARPSGRSAYRVLPDPDDPVILQLDGKITRVIDISASGFSCPAEVVNPGRRYPYSLDLPTSRRPISGYVDVLPDKESPHLHGLFVDLSADEADALHHYVLVRQKHVLRAIRDGKLSRTS